MQPNEPPPTPGVLYELRPNLKTFWRGIGTRSLILLPLIVLGIYNVAHDGDLGWAVVLYVTAATVIFIGVMSMLKTGRIVLTATTVEKHLFPLRPRVIQRHDIALGVLVPQYSSPYYHYRTAPLLILVGTNGSKLLRLTGQAFNSADLFTLAERYGWQSFDVINGIAGPRVVAARHQKIVPLWERSPAMFTLVGSVVLVVVLLVGVSIFAPGLR